MAFDVDALRESMRLYAVTDGAWLEGRSLAQCVRDAIAGGATFIQLRDKGPGSTPATTMALACELAPICREAGVPFVVDDDLDAARASGADGVHVGQSDAACAVARQVLGANAIVGVSVQTVAQALEAQEQGASYLGVGAMYGTPTKTDAVIVTREELSAICAAVDIPVVAIGGLKVGTLGILRGTNVDGAAVVSAIFAADDIELATRLLDSALDEVL